MVFSSALLAGLLYGHLNIVTGEQDLWLLFYMCDFLQTSFFFASEESNMENIRFKFKPKQVDKTNLAF